MFKLKTKILLLQAIVSSCFFIGCARAKTEPIEKKGGSKYVISKIEGTDWGRTYNLQLKNKDTIFWINVLAFDAKNVKVGDTIR